MTRVTSKSMRSRASATVRASRLGLGSAEMAARLSVSVDMVSKWRGRYARQGLEGLGDRPRSGRRPRLTPIEKLEIVSLACEPTTPVEVQIQPQPQSAVEALHEDHRARAPARDALLLGFPTQV